MCLAADQTPFPVLFAAIAFFGFVGSLSVYIVARAHARARRWFWPFMKAVRSFQTIVHPRFRLHYASGATGFLQSVPNFFECCKEELDELSVTFGFGLRGRVVIYVFHCYEDVAAIFGLHYGGTALSEANAVVVVANHRMWESIRHELVHLFAARWNRHALPLLSEGLAVWLQRSSCGKSIDAAARPVLRFSHYKLLSLLNPQIFFSKDGNTRHAHYLMAGSFTGFLLRRHGWQKYRKLYRKCQTIHFDNGARFRHLFQKTFGVSLEKAEWQWRNEVLVMEILNRRLNRHLRS